MSPHTHTSEDGAPATRCVENPWSIRCTGNKYGKRDEVLVDEADCSHEDSHAFVEKAGVGGLDVKVTHSAPGVREPEF